MPSIVLHQPDIPQNLGGVLRLCACLNTPLHVIEPCGFPFNDARLRRAGMDYIQHAELHRHASWEHFKKSLHDSPILSTATAGAERSEGGVNGATAPEGDDPPVREANRKRLILVETDGTETLSEFTFAQGDYLIFGSESSGTPRELYSGMDTTLRIPMRADLRSFNVAMSAGITLYEAYRQLRWAL